MKTKMLVINMLAIALVLYAPALTTVPPAPTLPTLVIPTLSPILSLSTPIEYPAPSTYYPMDNIHVVAVRPGGKELYVYSYETSDMILVVDIDSPDYPVIGKIQLSGRRPNHTYISFSNDGTRAFLSRALECQYEDDCSNFGDFVYVVVIDTEKKEIEFKVPMPTTPYQISPLEASVPSPNGKWLYFVARDVNTGDYGVAKIDLEERKVVDFKPLTGANFITIAPDGKRLYVTQGCNLFGAPPNPDCIAPNLFSIVDPQTLDPISSVAVGDGPRYIAVTPDGKQAYVSNQWSNNTSVINLDTMNVATLNVGADRSAIAITPNGKKAYVTLPGSYIGFQFNNRVAVIDVEKDEKIGEVEVHIEPLTIAMDPDGTRAYVSDGNANGSDPSEVHVIDTINDIYLRPIILRRAAHIMPTAIDITPDDKTLFVVREGGVENTVRRTLLLVIDAASRAVLHTLNIQPRGVKVSLDGTKVYVFCDHDLVVLNRETLQIIKSIDLRTVFPDNSTVGDQEVFKFVLNNPENIAYLLGVSNEIIVVDLTKGEIVGRIPFADQPIRVARGLALSPDGTKLFVSDYHSLTVAVIDAVTNTVITRIPVDNPPSEIKISPDGKRVYVLGRSGMTMLSIFAADTYTLLRKFTWSVSHPIDFELSQDERTIYFADFDPNFLIAYNLQEDKAEKIVKTALDPFNMVSTHDKRYIYTTNFTSDTISIFDTQINQIVDSIILKDFIVYVPILARDR